MHSGRYMVKALNTIRSSITPRHSRIRFYTVSVCVKLSYARDDSLQTLAQTIRGFHQDWGSLLSFVRDSVVKTDSPVATLEEAGDDTWR